MKRGEEAVDVWQDNFRSLLGEEGDADGDNDKSSGALDQMDVGELNWTKDYSSQLGQPISPEEVHWALNMVRVDAAPGQDGIGVEMMMADALFEVWMSLFKYVGKLVWYHHYGKRVWLFESLKRRTKVSVNPIILGECL